MIHDARYSIGRASRSTVRGKSHIPLAFLRGLRALHSHVSPAGAPLRAFHSIQSARDANDSHTNREAVLANHFARASASHRDAGLFPDSCCPVPTLLWS